jgi:hypothetical protein
MKIRNKTDANLFVTGGNTIFPEEAYIYSDHIFDTVKVCGINGSVYIIREYNDLCVRTDGDLCAIHQFDSELNDFLIDIFRVDKNRWFVQQDKILHDKAIRDASNHLPNSHIAAFKRIDELTDAIKKSIQICVPNGTTSDVKQICNWAKEIMLQCNIIDSIDED